MTEETSFLSFVRLDDFNPSDGAYTIEVDLDGGRIPKLPDFADEDEEDEYEGDDEDIDEDDADAADD